ncbi:hypothetical protein QBC33DRAFT_609276 [Phialemonium atrogriseum]|uniref:Phospholipid/glycerol acyltransferase domain-containing protein n=1 Tax=Phialemonium atrogriseum TaxID=1093897 RepID=A0AAJ0CAG6_9PEZI|nr:uncharacterized protein QBC33DRAFT_609276 [Phialemonium atrogriseum]KAK1770706.1 hypothetical protein QBC33DRAFT_609276 [Phialemonium atrogriseum]
MEKYSQFRDKGSGVSPFIPISSPTTALWTVLHVLIFLFRLPFFVAYTAFYFIVLHHLPLPVFARKLLLWGMMGIPGIWWVDLQLDGVKRGHLSSQPPERVPHPGSVIAASFTSPIDALYLAAVFDPIFTVSRPGSRKVRRVGLARAVALALSPAQFSGLDDDAPRGTTTTDLRALARRHPGRVIAVFPECATTNGRGILPFSPSLLAAPAAAPVFPVSIRYTPADITTPVPGLAAWVAFLWKLLSRPTHCIRVRIAEGVRVVAAPGDGDGEGEGEGEEATGDVTSQERRVLDRIAEALARLGRNKRVGLTLRDKARFVEAWRRGRK